MVTEIHAEMLECLWLAKTMGKLGLWYIDIGCLIIFVLTVILIYWCDNDRASAEDSQSVNRAASIVVLWF